MTNSAFLEKKPHTHLCRDFDTNKNVKVVIDIHRNVLKAVKECARKSSSEAL